VVVSKKTALDNTFELKSRTSDDTKTVNFEEMSDYIAR
jgi:hypothetical protein